LFLLWAGCKGVSHSAEANQTRKKVKEGMQHYYKITKHPQTGQFEKAAWLDMGTFYYVAFSDRRWYHEKYCAWECQEENATTVEEKSLLRKTA
jgi:hypothetical protein